MNSHEQTIRDLQRQLATAHDMLHSGLLFADIAAETMWAIDEKDAEIRKRAKQAVAELCVWTTSVRAAIGKVEPAIGRGQDTAVARTTAGGSSPDFKGGY